MPYLPKNEERRKRAENSCMEFCRAVARNSAFIPKERFERFESIRKKCVFQLNCFNYSFIYKEPLPQEQIEKCKQATSKLYDEQESLRDDLREYLETLDVL